MIIINTVDSKRFSLNGIEYFKNYISEVAGQQITIFNAYDRKDVKVDWEHFGNITLNSVIYGNVADLQSALLAVIYTRASLGNTGAVTSVNTETGDVVIDGQNITVTDPTTATDALLNDALENILAIGGGGVPTLQQVTDAGNQTTNTIQVGGIVENDFSAGGYGFIVQNDTDIFVFYPFVGLIYDNSYDNSFMGASNFSAYTNDGLYSFDLGYGYLNFKNASTFIGSILMPSLDSNKIWTLPKKSGILPITINGNYANENGEVLVDIPVITSAALTTNNDTNVTISLEGTPSTALLQPVNLTVGWSGTLADNRIESASNWNAKEDAANKQTNLNPSAIKFPTVDAVIMGLTSKQDVLSGTGVLKATSGVISYITGSAEYYIKADGSVGVPSLQQIQDFNHNLIDGIFKAGSGAGDNIGQNAIDFNALGVDAGYGNTQKNINALGLRAGYINSGSPLNALGARAGFQNSGNGVNALGTDAGLGNIFNNVNLFGQSASADGDGQLVFSKNESIFARFSAAGLNSTRKYILPDNDGTVALTSDIPAAITIDEVPTDGSNNAVSSNGTFDALATKVDKNTAITGATKTKITFDVKGLITSGADATTADIADSTNKRYVTDAQQTVIANTSGTNTGDNATNSQYSGLASSKENSIAAGTTAQYWRGDKTFQTLNKTAVGLANVDNTTDLLKPISTATQTALDAKRSFNRVTFSNANATIASTTRQLSSITTLTAPRTVTLPLASTFLAGSELIIIDEFGTINGLNNIIISRAGSDVINGGVSETITAIYGWRRFISNGIDKWNFDAGIVRQAQLDLKLNKSKFISKGYTQVTGVTGEVVIASILIPGGTYVSGESLDINVILNKSITANSVNFNLYHDTTQNGITNAISTGINSVASTRTDGYNRILTIDGTTLRNNLLTTSTFKTNYVAIGALGSNTTANFANDIWITLTGNPTATTEVIGINTLSIRPL